MKKVFLLGSNGQLGKALLKQKVPADWQWLPYDHAQLDVTQHASVNHEIETQAPDILINATSYTNVEKAQTDEATAMAVNFYAVANLAAICSVRDIPVVHVSTDFVFDGQRSTPYPVDDPMNPLNIYGKTKLLSEEALRQELAWHVIVRTSSLFSANPNNIATKSLQWIKDKEELRVVSDRMLGPTYANNLAKALVHIAEAIASGKSSNYGVYHYCDAPAVTQHDFVAELIKIYAPYAKKPLPKLSPASSSEFANMAPRPAYSVLDCQKIADVFGIQQGDWREGLKETVKTLMESA